MAREESSLPRLNDVLYRLLECIRRLGILLRPFLPATADSILTQLQVSEALSTLESAEGPFGAPEAFAVGTPTPLFARIDTEKVLAELKAEQEKAAAQEAKAAPEGIAFLPEITIDDFGRIDLRVAEVTACEPVKRAKKLLKLTLNDGSGEPRTVCSGIAPWYTPEQLTGKRVVLVSNLKLATLCGVQSCGMILAADDGEDVKVLFVDGVAPGSRVR